MVIDESEIRALAEQKGYILHRSAKRLSPSNYGQWMLIRRAGRAIVLGPRYNASLVAVHRYLNGVEL